MREISLQEMRGLQLAMLDHIHAFCTECGLRYSLGGGTLLGAVRHKGYIPWDDDIDIMMPRPDYERFLTEFEGQYEHLALQHYKNDDTYCFPFAKIYDNRTVLIEAGARNGIYVDVFPIDGLPDTESLASYYAEYRKLVEALFKTNKYYKFAPSGNRQYLRLKYYLKRLVYPSKQKTIRQWEQLYSSYPFESASFAGAIVGRYGTVEHMPAHVFKTYMPLPFESREYACIAHYDEYLSKHYGQYMQLPDEKHRRSNHQYLAYWK